LPVYYAIYILTCSCNVLHSVDLDFSETVVRVRVRNSSVNISTKSLVGFYPFSISREKAVMDMKTVLPTS
jgi:hypothetical protein